MGFIQVVVLAIVQGIGEFLPISSSGHLVVLIDLFKAFGVTLNSGSLTWNVALHFGTLISIFAVFWKRIWLLLSADKGVIPLLIIATIPTVLVVVGMKLIEKKLGLDMDALILENSLIAGCCFPITGLILIWCSDRSGNTICRDMSWKKAAMIGLAQGVAILPGISRSGSTICAGLLCGMKRDEAAAFSFLMAIPAIGGGTLLEVLKLCKEGEHVGSHEVGLLTFGTILSCVIGILALKLLLRWLQQGKLKYFACWLFLIGPAVVIWRLFFA